MTQSHSDSNRFKGTVKISEAQNGYIIEIGDSSAPVVCQNFPTAILKLLYLTSTSARSTDDDSQNRIGIDSLEELLRSNAAYFNKRFKSIEIKVT